MSRIPLTAHFSLHEFLYSETATRLGREIEAPPHVAQNLQRLCSTVLEPARVALGYPMVITSGYRPDWLNAAIGGSRTSAHMDGRAADVKVVGMSPLDFCRWTQARAWPFDQLIMEGTWTHIGIAPAGSMPRGQVLTAVFQKGGGVTYRPGLA